MRRYHRILLPLLLVGAAWAVGCGNTDTGDLTPNAPPTTTVKSSAPELNQTEFTIEFFWNGADADGWVDRFEWRISNNGPDGIIDREDTLGLDWNTTFAPDSVFVVSADIDSFLIDVKDPGVTNPVDFRFWQTHTFFVRSIDNLGTIDPIGARISFTATTIAPTIAITVPNRPNTNTCSTAARALTYRWEGNDPDDVVGDPEAVRYALVNTDDIVLTPEILQDLADEGLLPPQPGECYTERQYKIINPVSLFDEEEDWNDWIPYDAGEDSGQTVTWPLKDFGEKFIFAVQARDLAGAVTPTFVWETNVRHVEIAPGKLPLLTVTEQFLGSNTFTGEQGIKKFDVVAGQPMKFDWLGNAEEYAGIIEAYRYGWNIQDVNDEDDRGWAQPWGNGPAFLTSDERSFNQGNPNFVVQCRDNSGTISRGTYQLEVVQINPPSKQRNLLIIDDWGYNSTDGALKTQWKEHWLSLLGTSIPNFDPNQDYIFAGDQASRIEFRLVNDYKSVIWFINGGSDLTQFAANLRPQEVQLRYNWIEVYQARVGNILFCGPDATIGMIEPRGWNYPFVYNIPDAGTEGLGTRTLADGTEVNEGTFRWPYSGFCLESTDRVRPPQGTLIGEVSEQRTAKCDYIAYARVDSSLFDRFPSAFQEVEDLRMTPGTGSPRIPHPIRQTPEGDSIYLLRKEEFFNVNISSREVTLNLRPCQQVMYRMVAARDWVYPPGFLRTDSQGNIIAQAGDPLVPNDDEVCPPEGDTSSRLTRAPIGIVSTVYTDQKQVVGSVDFLWGFHPLAFNKSEVRRTLLWIIGEGWSVPVNP